MNTSKKAVLLFQPSRFQAKVWRSVLWEQKLVVIWEENYTHKKHIANYFKTLEFKPNLLIIDLKIDNTYEYCRCFLEYNPSSKIILTISPNECLSAIRFYAMNQGIDEVLINFQKENLLSIVTTNVNCALQLLNRPPAQQESLVRALDSLSKKDVSVPQGAIQLKESSIITKKPEQITAKTISPIIRLSFFIVILLIVTLALDVSTLYLISPVQRLQRQILAHTKKQKQSTKIKVNTFKELQEIPQGIFNYGGSTTWLQSEK